jgi:hypothetical protein
MEAIQAEQFTLKQILQQNWCSFLDVYHLLVQWYAAYNVWKVINCREPDGLGYATFADPPGRIGRARRPLVSGIKYQEVVADFRTPSTHLLILVPLVSAVAATEA